MLQLQLIPDWSILCGKLIVGNVRFHFFLNAGLPWFVFWMSFCSLLFSSHFKHYLKILLFFQCFRCSANGLQSLQFIISASLFFDELTGLFYQTLEIYTQQEECLVAFRNKPVFHIQADHSVFFQLWAECHSFHLC